MGVNGPDLKCGEPGFLGGLASLVSRGRLAGDRERIGIKRFGTGYCGNSWGARTLFSFKAKSERIPGAWLCTRYHPRTLVRSYPAQDVTPSVSCLHMSPKNRSKIKKAGVGTIESMSSSSYDGHRVIIRRKRDRRVRIRCLSNLSGLDGKVQIWQLPVLSIFFKKLAEPLPVIFRESHQVATPGA